MGDGLVQVLVGLVLQPEIALQDFLGILPDVQLAQVLQVGQPLEKQNALEGHKDGPAVGNCQSAVVMAPGCSDVMPRVPATGG